MLAELYDPERKRLKKDFKRAMFQRLFWYFWVLFMYFQKQN